MSKKQNILNAYIKKQKTRIKELEDSFKSTKKKEVEAPTGMQSWSDTTRFQEGELASKTEEQIAVAKRALDRAKLVDIGSKDCISVGSLFTLKDKNNDKVSTYFLICEECVSDIIDTEEGGIMFVSASSPLGKVLAGKKNGDVTDYKGKCLEVTGVQ